MKRAELRDVHLHGALGERFGRVHRLAVGSPAEAAYALGAMHQGFRHAVAGAQFHVVAGDVTPANSLSEAEIALVFPEPLPFHIIPAMEGAGKGALPKIVIGVVLIATAIIAPELLPEEAPAAFALGGSADIAIGMFGFGMLVAGISASMTHKARNQSSYTMSGAGSGANTTLEGGAIPIVYGTNVRVGSVVISASYQPYDISVPQPPFY